MGEESHLDEMRTAIRGDFERLADRRGSQELMRLDAAPEAEPDPVDAGGELVEPPRRSWLARLISPSEGHSQV